MLEEESDKIFLDTNLSPFQLEIDWESPPKFDEYPDEEEVVIHKVEENVKDEPMKEIIAEETIVLVAGKIARAEPMVGLVPSWASASFWCNKELSSNLVGDFLDDVLEEESDKIFFDNNTSSFQSEIDWESPPRFDEYADDEFEICETNVIEDIVHVAIQEDGIIGKIIDGSGETKFMSVDSIIADN
ncbi:hypothetical protein RHGRI_022636 [Rhododendron griersonianum]|uniref:Uncharacterized protein n=1 Tax=Rhododendron griersonianum TaxID=479676 RepID=A0AAV6J5Z1_9ERIC|nr:hypothetical protein RHGRI_022636 [Rhododendron griersonianum]